MCITKYLTLSSNNIIYKVTTISLFLGGDYKKQISYIKNIFSTLAQYCRLIKQIKI